MEHVICMDRMEVVFCVPRMPCRTLPRGQRSSKGTAPAACVLNSPILAMVVPAQHVAWQGTAAGLESHVDTCTVVVGQRARHGTVGRARCVGARRGSRAGSGAMLTATVPPGGRRVGRAPAQQAD